MIGQHERPAGKARLVVLKWMLRHGNVAPPHLPLPGVSPLSVAYLVRVRNTPNQQRGAWATFAKAAREGSHMSQAELARRLDVERTTIWRWETGKQKPESADAVALFARVLGIDVDEALAAAGLRPGTTAPAEPTREPDEEMDLIYAAPVDDQTKKLMIERLFQLRERDKQRRMEDIEFLIRQRDTA